MKLTNFFNLIGYYILLLSGLIYVSWIIWARFIRERTIRYIPDFFLNEFRFWILLYICAIYLYMIKNLIKPKEKTLIYSEIIEFIFKPLTLLDRSIKYNKYIISYYNRKSHELVKRLNKLSNNKIITFMLAMRIFPRFILILFLLLDTFYFHKLEIFYKVILIGLLPFVYRYIKYSIKDIYNYWVETLEDTYQFVLVFEEGYEYEFSRTRDTKAKYHYKRVSIKEFINLQYETIFEFYSDKIDYCYVGNAFAKDHLVQTYARNKYNDQDAKLTTEDYDDISKLFHDLYPLIINLKTFLNKIKLLEDKPIIKYSRILIYSIYLMCWSYILFTSYYHYPIDLPMFKILIKNLAMYLKKYDMDPFSMLNQFSKNENLITPENVWNLLKRIFNKIIQIIKNKLS